MQKPKNAFQLCGLIFAILGITFSVLGFLGQIIVLPPNPNSAGNPAAVFLIVGAVLSAMAVFLFIVVYQQQKRQRTLILSGTTVQGTVLGVKTNHSVRWCRQHPYEVYFSYEHQGVTYKGKSCLLWGSPDVSDGDTIPVFIDRNRPHLYATDIMS